MRTDTLRTSTSFISARAGFFLLPVKNWQVLLNYYELKLRLKKPKLQLAGDVEHLIMSTIKILVELRLTQNKKIDVFTAIALTQQQFNKTIDDIMIIEKVDPAYPEFH